MRIPVSAIVDYQLPSFVKEEYPLFSEFLKQYYLSDVSENLLQNLDKDLDIDVIFNLKNSAVLASSVSYNDSEIFVDSTSGFPDLNGLIKIDNEIILYKSKNETTFLGCVRGFSGITKIDGEFLEFSETELERHSENSEVINLSVLYLQQFALKIKKRITPGFEEREFFSELNSSNYIKNIKSFYTSKGSDESFRILFGALYGKTVDVIKPRDFLIRPSDAQYRVTKDLVIEVIEGDPYKLINSTIYQDPTDFIEPAQGTVVEVNKIIRKNKEYFIISLDYDYNKDVDFSGTTKSEFSIHPKTISTSKISAGLNYIDVDSTIGFPDQGELKVDLEDGTTFFVSYSSKVLNQFLDCSGIDFDIPEQTEIKINNLIYGIDGEGNTVTMFVTGVLGDIDYIDDTFYYKENEKIKIKTLGNDVKGFKANNWFFNISVTYDVQDIELEDSSDFSYKVTLFDSHSFVIGDSFTLYASNGEIFDGNIIFVENERIVIIKGQGEINSTLKYVIRKNISKINISNNEYSNLNVFNSNIQNIYTNYEEDLYISSPSLPTYLDFPIEIRDFILRVPAKNYTSLDEIEFTSEHGLFTGDSIVYKAANSQNSITSDGIYFVNKISNRKIKLAKSLEDVEKNIFITFNGTISLGFESFVELTKFNDIDLNRLQLRPQNLIKKLNEPELLEKPESTQPGTIGIFINGVEISNFKSEDSVFYGGITKVDILSAGDGYNVLNPPKVFISDTIGFGASITPAVEGVLERIDVVNPGFDYLDTPIISISGGGGSGAEAVVQLVSFVHSSDFNSETSVNFSTDIIEFNDDHRFGDNEQVVYRTDNQSNVSGIDTNAKYFVKTLDTRRVKLHYTLDDSSAGINTVNLTGIGTGVHSLVSVDPKKRISNIKVTNSGEGYKNKKVRVSGINTSSDTLTIIDHGYNSGEIITYYPEGSSIVGLTPLESYYVSVVDVDNIRLSGISTVELPESNFIRNEYVDIISEIPGNHYFNYPEIKVELSGRIGISTFPGQDLTAKIQPVFSGKIYSAFIENKGEKYGSQDIINYERKPVIQVETGRNAQVTPIILNGSIVRVVVNSTGTGYQQIPELIITPNSNGAILTPVLTNGKLIEVIVVNGGQNLDPEQTSISVIPKGIGVNFNVSLESRRINTVERLIKTKNITRDDGYLIRSIDSLQYTHLYASRAIRQSSLRKVGDNNVRDLNFVADKEQKSTEHSPLIGWAYDGNPIYGPYGYGDGNSGAVRALKSGYQLKSISQLQSEDRPSISIYPIGFFVEDYIFTVNGDLDEHNGRFCITPEYPNGTYAYFCTISDFISDSSSPFANYFQPVFPYIIGLTYKNKPISAVDRFEDLGNKILRNTTPYNLLSSKSSYDFILNPSRIKEESLQIIKTKSSVVDEIRVIDSGTGYKVNDIVTLTDNTIARVNSISGVAITSINVLNTSLDNLEVIPFRNSYVGIFTNPHQLVNTKQFKFNSEFELNKKILAAPYNNTLSLSSKVEPTSITGIITYFNVNGSLSFPLKENDVYSINEEKIKILNLDNKSSRIRVLRDYLSTSGINTHEVNSPLIEDSRKITFNIGLSTNYNFKVNSEFYFDPSESLGIGTIGNYTLNISNPGLGNTIITIPVQSVYLNNHQLNSGDSLFYFTNGGTEIEVSYNGIDSTTLPVEQELFVTKINNDLIGLSTGRSGIGKTDGILYFTSVGAGVNHSFKTNYDNILLGNIEKNTVTVATAATHGLNISDTVNVNVVSGIQTTYAIYYNDYNRRLVVNKRVIDSVNLLTNTITSTDHKFEKGEKVIYESNSAIGGLSNNEFYYIIPVTKDTFKLSKTYYNSVKTPVEEINLTSSGNGEFLSVNPKIKIIKDQNIVFDVSDQSLSFVFSGETYSAFDLKLYYDNILLNEYSTYDLVKFGKVGIDSTANYTLITKNLPDVLYYSLSPINAQFSPVSKKEINYDFDQINAFQLHKENSIYSGEHSITSISSTTFSYEVEEYPEEENYNFINSTSKYSSTSTVASGPIESLKITNFEVSKELPQVKEIISENGQNAELLVVSSDIGSIEKIKKLDIGFDYTVDYTIRPKGNIPKIIKLTPLYQLESVGIQTRGFGYSYPPDLILIDQTTKEKYSDLELEYKIDENKVLIIQNTNRIRNSDLRIVPINNDNGFSIDEINYDTGSRVVTVKLKTGFNDIDDFPFTVGEKVYIENVPLISGSTVKGYNSSNYGYASFEILSTSPNIGGVGATFSYSIASFVGAGTTLGVVDNFYTNGFAIPDSYLPFFNIKIKNNDFFKNETIRTVSGATGEVVDWDTRNNTLKVISSSDIEVGDIIYGETSNNYSKITEIYSPESYVDINSNSVVNKGWSDSVGFLNDSLQRVHDSNYYQYFSYDLRSEVNYNTWTNPVDSLNHTSGFKKFGNLLVNSKHENVGFNTNQNLGDVEVINDLQAVLDVNCVSDFDLVTENYFNIEGALKSNEIYFNSRRLQNYIESIGNKVIIIDDISDKFKPVTPIDETIIDSFNKFFFRFKKYIIHISDGLNPINSQSLLLNLLHNDNIVAINQYAINDSNGEFGFFDARVNGLNLEVTFSPIIVSNKVYSINSFSFNISDSDELTGNISLGDVIEINSSTVTGIGTTTIIKIPDSKSASKVLIVYSDQNNNFYYSDEINYIQDGTNIFYNSYGELNLGESAGIGTYSLFYDGSDINVQIHPSGDNEFNINAISIEMSDLTSTSTDFLILSGNKLESAYVGVTTSGAPQKTLIYSYTNSFTSGLHQILIETESTNIINYTEILTMLNSSNQDVYSVEFGKLNSKNEIGIIESEYSALTGDLEIYFTPYQDISYQARIFSTLTSKFRRSETLEI
jgi:hypothetical protein